MNIRLEEILHGKSECPASRLKEGFAGSDGGVIGRNTNRRYQTSAVRGSSVIVLDGVCTLIARRSGARAPDESRVVVGEAYQVIGVAGQVELAQRVI